MKSTRPFRILFMSMVALFIALGCFFTSDFFGPASLSDSDATRTQIALQNQDTLAAFNATLTARATLASNSARPTVISITPPAPSTDISPELIAKAFTEALIDADMVAMQATLCQSAWTELDAEMLQPLVDSIASLDEIGGELDISNLTYTYNPAENSVFISGNIKIIVNDDTINTHISMESLFPMGIPIVQENGMWKVCPIMR